MFAPDPETALAYLAEVVRPIVLVELDWATGPIRLHDGRDILMHDGTPWHGVGHLGGIEEIHEAPGLSVQELVLTQVVPPSQWAAVQRRNFANRPGWMWLGALDEDFRSLVGKPLLIYEGEMRGHALKISSEKDGSIKGVVRLTLQGFFGTVRRVVLRRSNSAYLATLPEQILHWPEKS